MNNLLNTFSRHLIHIGFANEDTIPQIQQLFKEIYSSKESTLNSNQNNNNKNTEEIFKETMLATLMFYLSSLNDETKEKMSLSILLKFFANENSNLTKSKLSKLKTCILLCNVKNALSSKSQVNNIFNKWKLNSSKNKNNSITPYSVRIKPHKLHNSSHSYRHFQTQNKVLLNSHSPAQYCPKYNKLRLETSLEKKEKEDQNECTFHPDTTLSNSYHRPTIYNDTNTLGNSNNPNNESVYDRLYRDSEKYETKRQIRKIESEHKLSETYNFKPDLNSTKNKFRNKSEITFNERQQSFLDKKMQNKEKLQHIMEEINNTKCSFSPKINSHKFKNQINSDRSNSQPAHIRLYEDDKNRRIKSNQKIREINQQITEQCNSFVSRKPMLSNINSCYEPNVNTSSSNNISFNNNTGNSIGFDSNKIEQLYKQYKKRPAKIQKIRQAMELESGITFEPYLNRNNKYYSRINTNVIERTEQLLENKKKFVNDVNEAQERYWQENQYGYKKYTQNEKEEITQRIIQRLYGRGYLQCNYATKANHNYIPTYDVDKNNDEVMNNSEKQNYEMELDEEEEIRSDNVGYTQENRIQSYEIQNEMERDGNHALRKEEEEEDRKYNDKIISLYEFNFGKNKKKNY